MSHSGHPKLWCIVLVYQTIEPIKSQFNTKHCSFRLYFKDFPTKRRILRALRRETKMTQNVEQKLRYTVLTGYVIIDWINEWCLDPKKVFVKENRFMKKTTSLFITAFQEDLYE